MAKMENKYFAWDEISDGLILLSAHKAEDTQVKRIKQKFDVVHDTKIYCPHSYLILNFHETLSEREKLKFRRHYLRKVSPNEPDIIILQDIKDLVMFLLATPISPQFVNFFHLPIVDRFLRAMIIYFQYYIITWEELLEEYAATIKKAPNPLAQGYRSKYAEEMQNLRCILGREYADLIVGCQDTIQYHHMTGGKKGAAFLTQSEGEKDLRTFEILFSIAHRVVWIALQRKHFSLIEIELHRLFRTKAYNMAERRSAQLLQKMLIDDVKILHGQELQFKRKLLRNSPLIQELIYSHCDYRLLALGANSNDERILYLQNALLIEEEKLHELGIKIGILGESRANYNITLIPHEETELNETQSSERIEYERKGSTEDILQTDVPITTQRLPQFQSNFKLPKDFPLKAIDITPRKYKTVREEARKKWFIREIKRQKYKQRDALSMATSLD